VDHSGTRVSAAELQAGAAQDWHASDKDECLKISADPARCHIRGLDRTHFLFRGGGKRFSLRQTSSLPRCASHHQCGAFRIDTGQVRARDDGVMRLGLNYNRRPLTHRLLSACRHLRAIPRKADQATKHLSEGNTSKKPVAAHSQPAFTFQLQ